MSNEFVNIVLWTNVVVFGTLSVIWTGSNWGNLIVKVLLLVLTVANVLLALQ